MKVLPPETSFGDAWEALCFDLIAADKGSQESIFKIPVLAQGFTGRAK